MAESIKIWCNEIVNGWSPKSAFLPGSENFVRQFAEMGGATVYMNGFEGEHNGAIYKRHDQFDSECDLLLIVKDAKILDLDLKSKRVIYYTNDIFDQSQLTPKRLDKVEKVIALSNFHKDVFLSTTPKVQVVSHGIKVLPNKYTRKKNLCLYASSPDRGLSKLLRDFELIKKEIPDAELEIAYNGRSDEEMERLFWEADFWLYPCSGIELYCIAGIRAQAHGCFPIVVPTMALAETVKFGIKCNSLDFVKKTIEAMKNRELVEREREKMLVWRYPTIEEEFRNIVA